MLLIGARGAAGAAAAAARGGGLFDPSTTTGLLARWKASADGAVTHSGGTASALADLTATGANLIQPTSARQPGFPRLVNGVEALDHDGSDDHLYTTGLDFGGGEPAVTFISWFVADAAASGNYLLTYFDGSTSPGRVFGVTVGDNDNNPVLTTRHFNGAVVSSDPITLGAVVMMVVHKPANAVHDDMVMEIDGVPQTMTPTSPGSGITFEGISPNFVLGGEEPGGSNTFDGAMLEALAISGFPPVEERNALGAYGVETYGASYTEI